MAVCLRLTLPSPPPLHPEPAAKSERRKRKERERESTLAIPEPSFLRPPRLEEMSDVQEPFPWGKSSATMAVLEQLVADRLLPLNPDSGAPAWISLRLEETEP